MAKQKYTEIKVADFPNQPDEILREISLQKNKIGCATSRATEAQWVLFERHGNGFHYQGRKTCKSPGYDRDDHWY